MSPIKLFGGEHGMVLAAVGAAAWGLSAAARRFPAGQTSMRRALGVMLAGNELIWYGYRLHTEGFRFPEALPLNLCDLALWLTVVSALTLKPLAFETAYFAGLGGSGMALLTPELWAPMWTYPTTYFFLSHGLVVATLCTLAWSGMGRLRPGCVWRVFGVLNLFAGVAGGFNAIFRTNYMFLCEKPATASLLDYFGPWPWYIATAEVFALGVFGLLYWPVRGRASHL